MNKVFIIAEAGVNHNGCLRIAKRLVDAAVESGADAIKFQSFRAENIVTRGVRMTAYQSRNMGGGGTQFSMLKKLELSPSAHKEIFNHCKKRKIIFIATPYDEESVDMLDELGLAVFKISSGDITNKPLIRHIAFKGKPIILSTGMSYLEEVRRAVKWIKGAWTAMRCKPSLTLMHCVSDYPAKKNDVNLMAIKTLKANFGLPVGYSDHTIGIEIAIAAVASGAVAIEKHLTLDRNMKGPDHRASIEPDELKSMVTAIKNIISAMGDGIKRPAASERETKLIARKSLVAARDIAAGEVIRRCDISVKRPGTGISPEFMDRILNRRCRVPVRRETLFEYGHFIKNRKII